jgi:hypothetical protein
MNETIIEFYSKYCKNNQHHECLKRWNGLGFEVICSCICHRNITKKNVVLDGPSKSSSTDYCLLMPNANIEVTKDD